MAGVKITQLSPQKALGKRYSSFAGKPDASAGAGGVMIWHYVPQVLRGGR